MRQRVATIGLLAFTTVVAPVTASVAAPAEPIEPGLEIGPWNLLGEATGRASSSTGGVTVTFFGRFPVEAQVNVPAGGAPSGEWTITGGQGDLSISGPGLTADAVATATGSGTVAGTASELVLTGPVTIAATATVSVAGQEVSESLTDQVDGMMRWRVLGETCDQAWGEWVFVGDYGVQDNSFNLELEGRFTGFRGDDFVVEELGDLLDQTTGATEAPPDSRSSLFNASAELITAYNRLVDDVPFSDWSLDDVVGMADRAEQLLGLLDEFTECDGRLFGEENIARVKNGLTWSVQGLLVGLGAQTEPIPSTAFSHLAHLGARVGAFGPGAENPAQAVAAEEILRSAGQEILDANADPEDGGVFVNDDTERVIVTGAAMGWQFNVGAGLKPAAEIYEDAMGEPASDQGSEGDG